jgi:hypothetical protein
MEKNPDPGSGINISVQNFQELRNSFSGQKYLNSMSIQCWGAGSRIWDGKIEITDPGWNNPNPA